MAGPFEANEYLKAIPADKKLDPAWIRSLFERGDKQTYVAQKVLPFFAIMIGFAAFLTVFPGFVTWPAQYLLSK